jgi:hypothetical protein
MFCHPLTRAQKKFVGRAYRSGKATTALGQGKAQASPLSGNASPDLVLWEALMSVDVGTRTATFLTPGGLSAPGSPLFPERLDRVDLYDPAAGREVGLEAGGFAGRIVSDFALDPALVAVLACG